MEKLKSENFFKTIFGNNIFLTFSVNDYEFNKIYLKKIIIRLNDKPYQDEFFEW